MRLRRKPQRTLTATATLDWGSEIARLRRGMNEAVASLYAGEPNEARLILSRTLAERWWK